MLCFFISLLFCLQTFANDHQFYFYRVQPDDNITKILYKAGLKPIYGRNGSYQLVYQTNKSHFKTFDHLISGRKIQLTQDQAQQAIQLGYMKLKSFDSRELVFTNKAKSQSELRLERESSQITTIQSDNTIQDKTLVVTAAVESDISVQSIKVGLSNQFIQMKATEIGNGSHAEYNSTLGLEGYVRLDQRAASGLGWYQQVSLGVVQFQNPQGFTGQIGGKTSLLSNLEVGISKIFSPDQKLELGFGYTDELYANGLSSTSTKIENEHNTEVHLKFNQSVFNFDDKQIMFTLSGSYLLPGHLGSVQVKDGFKWSCGLESLKLIPLGRSQSTYLNGSVLYQQRQQNTTTTEHSEKRLQFGVDISF